MFKTTSTFDKLLDKATSHLLLEPDWPSIMQICDLIRQNDVQPKYAIMTIKKKLYNSNPHCAMYALQVLESIVKNCGSSIHEELTSKQNCEMLRELAKTSQHENVRAKVLELIQAWTFAFRNKTKYRALKDTMHIMKTEGFKFPTLRETDAMFSADNAPEWTDGDVCHRCRVAFSFVQRKHHCRACGQVFCGQCSQKTTTLPKFGIEKEVRVCDACFEQANKPSTSTNPTADTKNHDSDLPAEYLASSLAQQNQAPPRKSEDELREEEELQLALALSKSEAEEKEKEKLRVTSAVLSNAEVHRSPVNNTPRSLSPPPEDQSMDPELARYLNRTYWESRQKEEVERPTSPSAPSPMSNASSIKQQVNGIPDPEMDDFVQTLKSQVEIFVNRMKSNSSRGRSIANDSSVQTLFMNITAMHSRLLRYIQQQDDSRLYYEGLQDKLVQIKDARAALDALREEHCEKLRRQAEEAERQRQLQMAHKLDIMRKKKQEYLQYQRQLALQRIQEQEREMQMRQEQQKQQYLMGSQYPYIGSPVHGGGQQYGAMNAGMYYHQYNPVMGVPQAPPPQGPAPPAQPIPIGVPVMHQPGQNQGPISMGLPPQQVTTSQAPPNNPLPANMHQIQAQTITSLPQGQGQTPLQQPPPVAGQLPNPAGPSAQLPPGMGIQSVPGLPPNHSVPGGALPTHVLSAPNIGMSSQPLPVMQSPVVNTMSGQHIATGAGMPQAQPQPQQQFQAIMPQQPIQPKTENTVAELISFD